MTNVKALLERLERNEQLDSPILGDLKRQGYIEASDVTNMQTPPGTREYLFIRITEKGRQILGR
jgi:DNA-binding PadR family transcriptional regulator